MFDISRYSTVKNITEWVTIFKQNNIPIRYSPVILVGGKIDLEDRRVISKQEGFQIAGKHEFFKYIECSSKTGENAGVSPRGVFVCYCFLSRISMENGIPGIL